MSWFKAIWTVAKVFLYVCVIQLVFLTAPSFLLIKYVGVWAAFTYIGLLIVGVLSVMVYAVKKGAPVANGKRGFF